LVKHVGGGGTGGVMESGVSWVEGTVYHQKTKEGAKKGTWGRGGC